MTGKLTSLQQEKADGVVGARLVGRWRERGGSRVAGEQEWGRRGVLIYARET